jgi:glycosyltransferase involved in cell wall biosynthesis
MSSRASTGIAAILVRARYGTVSSSYARHVVGISLLTLVPGISGGSETYARELCRALARVGTLQYCAFLPAIAADASDGLPWSTVGRYRASRTMPGRVAAMSLAAFRPQPLRRDLELDRLDAIHFPLSLMLPRVDQPPAATTVLDLQHEDNPEFFGRAELTYRKIVYGWTIRRSRIVITISEHARQTLIERYQLAPDRVRAIQLAVDHDVFTPSDKVSQGGLLLYPARHWAHKNHARLFEAFAQLRGERPDLRLVLTGEGDFGKLPEGVEARGRVSRGELVELYRSAAALVFPSLYEGFGTPVVEAMACGCPVACSNVTSLPEVAGGAARLFDPRDVDEIVAAVEGVLDDPEPWRMRGLERAKDFTWDTCARAHDEVYRELSSG